MLDTIEEYLDTLKREMKGSDPALIKDALSDARSTCRWRWKRPGRNRPK